MSKHTPGPWNANFTRLNGDVMGFHVTGGRSGSLDPICECSHDTKRSPEEIEANGYLLEAAPELLEALKLAVRQNSFDMLMTGEELRQCEAAIAKATGTA